MQKKTVTAIILIMVWQSLKGEEKPSAPLFSNPDKAKIFTPVLAIETWITLSMDEKIKEEEIENRLDVLARRFRFGGKGKPYSWLCYNFEFSMDWLGKDAYSSTEGSYSGVSIWKAFITANPLKNSELLHLHAGYFQAVISREYNTSPWGISSFDKSRASWHLRNYMTGKGNGIASGLGLGGLKNYNNIGFSYRIGLFSPEQQEGAKYANPLITARLMLTLGQPEQTNYAFMLSGNQWRKRNGITLGFGASRKGKTENEDLAWNESLAYGTDLLINYRGWRLDGEYYLMERNYNLTSFNATEWHLRASFNIAAGATFVEPSFLVEKYDGKGEKTLYKFIGDELTYDAGVNWYLDKEKLKLALHYIIQEGTASKCVGNYFGLGLQFRL